MPLLKSAVTEDQPTINEITNHHYAPSAAGRYIGAVVASGIAVFLLWQAIVYLLGQKYDKPETIIANAFVIGFWILIIIAVLFALSIAANPVIDKITEYKLQKRKLEIEALKYQQRMMESHWKDTRARNKHQARLYQLIEQIMDSAYQHDGDYAPNEARPWGKRQAKEMQLIGENLPVGESMAIEAAKWLRDKNVIVGGNPNREQINKKDYPELATLQRKIRHIPILY